MKTASNTSIVSFVSDFAAQNTVSFHMPGHKGRRIFDESGFKGYIDSLVDEDITEIKGADNLFQPEGIIRATMDKYKEIYGSRETYLLVGGSSAGVLASILTCVPRGGKLLIAANCHKSAWNALSLIGAMPVCVYPEVIKDFGISGSVSPADVRAALAKDPDISAVLITSPNYYGVCSDIEEIAKAAHEAGKLLIVDEAHGAHLKIMKNAGYDVFDADTRGADITVASTHKTLASFTQAAIVNIYSDDVELDVFENYLQIIESSSPSYILTASHDMNADIIKHRGAELMKCWNDCLDEFYAEAKNIEGLKLIDHPMHDRTKIDMDFAGLGINGKALDAMLTERGIHVELASGNVVMGLSGIGNVREDYQRLLAALKEISAAGRADLAEREAVPSWQNEDRTKTLSELLHREKHVFGIPDRSIPTHYSEAAGKICAVAVIPYPPGIPLFVPGELMDKEALEFAWKLRKSGEKVIGMDERGYISAGRL